MIFVNLLVSLREMVSTMKVLRRDPGLALLPRPVRNSHHARVACDGSSESGLFPVLLLRRERVGAAVPVLLSQRSVPAVWLAPNEGADIDMDREYVCVRVGGCVLRR